MECCAVVAHNLKSATRLRTFWTKRRDYDVPPFFHGVRTAFYVSTTVLFAGEEVKYSAVVPNIVVVTRQICGRNVIHAPVDVLGENAEPRLADVDGFSRNVEDCKVPISGGQQVVNQSRFPASYIDDRRVVWRDPLNQLQGRLETGKIPADRIRSFHGVDGIPMIRGLLAPGGLSEKSVISPQRMAPTPVTVANQTEAPFCPKSQA